MDVVWMRSVSTTAEAKLTRCIVMAARRVAAASLSAPEMPAAIAKRSFHIVCPKAAGQGRNRKYMRMSEVTDCILAIPHTLIPYLHPTP